MLANVMMRSDLIERLFKEYGSEAALEEIRSLKKMVRDALYEVRRIIYDLRPMALDDLGLSPTLRKYLRTIEDYYRTATITYQFFGKEQRLDSKTEVSLFRLVQEAVQNALKHAEANEITVKVEMKNNLCTIIVRDDGKGFDVNQKKEKSFGIMGMRERVELLNGTLSIKSTIGAGTVVTIQVPINKRK
ncbi:MAG: sensor histidine kinase, partial [Bacillales bacterium]